jgi:hypothetical protein
LTLEPGSQILEFKGCAMRFLVLILLSFQASASVWDRQDAMAKCSAYNAEIQYWWSAKDKSSDNRIIPSDKIDRALSILDSIQYPSDRDVQAIKSAIAGPLSGDTAEKYLAIAPSDCPPVRSSLGVALANAAAKTPAKKVVIAAALKKMINATKYPTFLDASIDALVTDKALGRGLWPSDGSQKSELAELRKELKDSLKRWRKEYGADFDRISTPEKTPKPSNEDQNKIKTAVVAEQNEVLSYFARIQTIAAKLQSTEPN